MKDGHRRFRFSPDQIKTLRSIVKQKDGRWKGVSEAAKILNVNRVTISDYLRLYPEEDKARRVQPEYFTTLEKTRGYVRVIEYFSDKKKNPNKAVTFLRKAFPILNKKDPMGWTLEDCKALARDPIFFDMKRAKQFSTEPRMAANSMVALRAIMRGIGHTEWENEEIFGIVGLKRQAGMKKQWWLRKEEVRKIADAITEIGTRVLFEFACYTGSRISAYFNALWGAIDLENGTWTAFEKKTGTPVDKILNVKALNIIREYHAFMSKKDMAKATDKLFPRGERFYSDRLEQAGIKSGLCKTGEDPNSGKIIQDLIHGYPLSWHMTRHTFASGLAQAGVPMQHIMQQGPWSDSNTLLTYYAAVDPKKVREDMDKLDFGG